jgi:hypothetical protein
MAFQKWTSAACVAFIVGTAPVVAMAQGQAAPTAEPAESQSASSRGPKLICKDILRIGSLVETTKVCLTRRQWERSADNHQEYARDMVDALRTKPGF